MTEDRKKSVLAPSYKKNASIIKIVGACILVCVAFALGFIVRGNTNLMVSLGVQEATELDASGTSTSTYSSLSARVAEVESILNDDSVDDYDITTATDLVLGSFIDSTGDSYLHYYDQQSYATYLASASSPESGIGVLFGELDGACYAVDVFEGSQAAAAGVQAGDFVVAIDGENKETWTMAEVVNTLSRAEGEMVYVTWSHPASDANGTATSYSTELAYGSYSEENVTYSLDGTVAVVDMKQISSDSSKTVRSAVEQAVSDGAGSIVLDLRDVPGGYLTQAVEIASAFMQSGTVVQIKTNDATTTKTVSGEVATTLPMVVLVNERTAGSAEVLAAALQESGRATVVGSVTQGKGSVQVMQPLSFGGALRYTAAVYLTAKGRSLDGSGVSPDVSISDADSQMEMAVSMARSRAASV